MNFEKFKQLSFAKKLQWILQYYGIWIAVAVVAVCVGCIFLNSVFNPPQLSDVCVIVLSDSMTRDDIGRLEEEIGTFSGGSATVEIYSPSEEYGLGAFSIKLTTDQIDLVLAPKEQTDQMLSSGYLTTAEKIETEDLYIGTTQRARQGDVLKKTLEYFKGL